MKMVTTVEVTKILTSVKNRSLDPAPIWTWVERAVLQLVGIPSRDLRRGIQGISDWKRLPPMNSGTWSSHRGRRSRHSIQLIRVHIVLHRTRVSSQRQSSASSRHVSLNSLKLGICCCLIVCQSSQPVDRDSETAMTDVHNGLGCNIDYLRGKSGIDYIKRSNRSMKIIEVWE